MQGIENLPFCWAQGHSSLGRGASSCSTSEALSSSGDDEFEDGSFLLRHLFLFYFFLTGFFGSSIGFGFFILILFGCFCFSYFSSKRGKIQVYDSRPMDPWPLHHDHWLNQLKSMHPIGSRGAPIDR
jgi:hypothetical protein